MNTISVLIPCYNAEKYIDRCINSVLNQHYPYMNDVKIICINDGSTDKTLEKLYAIQKRIGEDKLIVRTQTNRGAYQTKLDLFKNLTTDWCVSMDCDDEWERNALLKLSLKFKNNPDCIYFGLKWNHKVNGKFYRRLDNHLYFGKSKIKNFINKSRENLVLHFYNVNFIKRVDFNLLPQIIGNVRGDDVLITNFINSYLKSLEVVRKYLYLYHYNVSSLERNIETKSVPNILPISNYLLAIDKIKNHLYSSIEGKLCFKRLLLYPQTWIKRFRKTI
ncbi:MAG: glycosyltransferase family 2 protein [Mycoplasmoidaceae bacterium]|nr:MAG: glycosyltransferase family 2 protein [Mycoplasmoidaceae bacterium]